MVNNNEYYNLLNLNKMLPVPILKKHIEKWLLNGILIKIKIIKKQKKLSKKFQKLIKFNDPEKKFMTNLEKMVWKQWHEWF